jgi:predicted ribosome quality control (RQC) complex YloA/Tae2 family protein
MDRDEIIGERDRIRRELEQERHRHEEVLAALRERLSVCHREAERLRTEADGAGEGVA